MVYSISNLSKEIYSKKKKQLQTHALDKDGEKLDICESTEIRQSLGGHVTTSSDIL